MALTARQVLDLAIAAGWQGNDAITATAIAFGESAGNPYAHNPVGLDDSYGLWQINMRGNLRLMRLAQFGLASVEALYDPSTNARVAFQLYAGRGRTFLDWGAFTNGSYKRYLPSATTAWAQRAAEQPNPAVTPPNPTAGLTPIPAAAGSTSAPVSTTAAAPAPAASGSISPASVGLPSWVRLLLWALSFYRGTGEKPNS